MFVTLVIFVTPNNLMYHLNFWLEMENIVVWENKVYQALECNGINIKVLYLLISSKDTIKLWMRKIDGYTTEMMDKAIEFLSFKVHVQIPLFKPYFGLWTPQPTHLEIDLAALCIQDV